MLLCNDMIKWYVEAAENLFTIFINILSPYKITHMWWLSNDVVKWYVEAAENLFTIFIILSSHKISQVYGACSLLTRSQVSHIFLSL